MLLVVSIINTKCLPTEIDAPVVPGMKTDLFIAHMLTIFLIEGDTVLCVPYHSSKH